MDKRYHEKIELKAVARTHDVIDDFDEFWKNLPLTPRRNATPMFSIIKKRFTKRVVLTGKFENRIEFRNCYFDQGLDLSNFQSSNTLYIQVGGFGATIVTSEKTSIDGEFLITEVGPADLYFDGGNFNQCIYQLEDNSNILINSGVFREMEIGWMGIKSVFEKIEIFCSDTKGQITIFGEGGFVEIHALNIRGIMKDLVIELKSPLVNNLLLKVQNNNRLDISTIRPINRDHSKIDIQNSDLGKTKFSNIDFSEYRIVNFKETHCHNCEFIDVTWGLAPTAYQDCRNQVIDNKYYSRLRDILRQLKQAYATEGDAVNKQLFSEREMDAYTKTLSWKGHASTKLARKAIRHFGQGLGKPIIAWAIGHFVLFCCAIMCGAIPNLSFDATATFNFEESLYQFILSANPARSLDKISTGRGAFFDILMRGWAVAMLFIFTKKIKELSSD